MRSLVKWTVRRFSGSSYEIVRAYGYYYLLSVLGLVRKATHNPQGLDDALHKRVGRTGGFFVEAGAYDGIYASNTYLLERYFGWHGLLVEPVPKFAKLCRRFRRRSATLNCALGAFDDGPTVDILVSGSMSVVDDDAKLIGIQSALAHAESGLGFVGDQEVSTVTVDRRPLSELLDEIGQCHVDILSLDVEGNEIAALSGIDFSRHTIDYILVETRDLERVSRLLEPLYRVDGALSHHDYLFTRN